MRYIEDLIEVPPELLIEALLLEAQGQGEGDSEVEEPSTPE
jgi:hypothetical protein